MSRFIADAIGGIIGHLVNGDDGNDLEAIDGPGDVDNINDDDDDSEDTDDSDKEEDTNLIVSNVVGAVTEVLGDEDELEEVSDGGDDEENDDNDITERSSVYLKGTDPLLNSLDAAAAEDEIPVGALSTWFKDLKLLENARRNLPAHDARYLLAPKKKKKMYNRKFNIAAPLDRISGPVYGPDEWITNRDASSLVYDENARAKQAILRLVIPGSSAAPPPRGLGYVIVPPNSLTEVRFEAWMMLTTPELYTINVVSTFHLGGPISLHRLAQRLLGAAYSPLRFSALIIRDPLATYMIFLSGRVVVAGATSRMSSFIACQSLVGLLKRCDMMAEVLQFSEQNDVATASTGFAIDLVKLARAYPLYVYYEPKCFPGAMMRFMSSQLVMIIFTGGKLILTGVDKRRDSDIGWRWVHSYILWHFELKTERFYYNEADYSRKEKQRDSIVESVCQAICEITQSGVQDMIRRRAQLPEAERMVFDAIYEEHLDPEKQIPCIILPDDDDDNDNNGVGNDDDDNTEPLAKRPKLEMIGGRTVKHERNVNLEHPALQDASPLFRRIVTMCSTLDVDAEALALPTQNVFDVEKWLEEDELRRPNNNNNTNIE